MTVKYVYAGNRQISVDVLMFLMNRGVEPSALIIPENGSHNILLKRVSKLPDDLIFTKIDEAGSVLADIQPDYGLYIHYPNIIPEHILNIPKYGSYNLHPAYLPWNRGWHTPSWAIMDQTPYGATLHQMTGALDSGDIISQTRVIVLPGDTADSLYKRALAAEYELFVETWPFFEEYKVLEHRKKQGNGTAHKKTDLKRVQELDSIKREFIRTLAACTTNDYSEACWFEENGKRYAVQVRIQEL